MIARSTLTPLPPSTLMLLDREQRLNLLSARKIIIVTPRATDRLKWRERVCLDNDFEQTIVDVIDA